MQTESKSTELSSVTIYHNPKCSTSRNTLALIREHHIEPTIIHYLEAPPNHSELRDLLTKMKMIPRDLLRTKEVVYADLQLQDAKWTDDELIDIMVKNPILIERPIVVTSTGAVLCRPFEKVLDILPKVSFK